MSQLDDKGPSGPFSYPMKPDVFFGRAVMIEADFTRAVHDKLPPTVKAWKIRDDYQGGVPDAFYRRRDGQPGRPLWVEYKFLKAAPVRDTTLVVPGLSELQKLWLREADQAGEQVQVIVGIPGEGVVFTLEEALRGITAGKFRERLLPYRALAAQIAEKVMSYA